VAFFTDSFHEVNGVALTSREFARHAADRGYPFFSVHTGPETRYSKNGELETFEIAHSALVLELERDLAFDLLFFRHRARLRRQLEAFRPSLVHVTGPSHVGMLGAMLAYDLKVPLVASWHTNLHEFAARRLERKLAWRRRESANGASISQSGEPCIGRCAFTVWPSSCLLRTLSWCGC
jgi:hypothetical protein